MMKSLNVRIGFVPSYRFGDLPWCQKMRDDSLSVFAEVKGMETLVPVPLSSDENSSDGGVHTPNGMVSTLDQAELVADYFHQKKVDGLILCPLDFGDERSACKIAEKLRVPVLLYATKEPEAKKDPGLGRKSDSYCGNLAMASGLYRRKILFHYAGIFFPEEPEFQDAVQTFVRAVAVTKGMKGAYLGQVGVRPPTFETVGYNEAALIHSFGQNVIYVNMADIIDEAKGYGDAPVILEKMADIRKSFSETSVSDIYLRHAAQLEHALTKFWEENNLSGMAMQCWPSVQRMMGICVCSVFGRLTSKGMLTACETDLLGVLAMLVNYRAAMGETVPHFVDWTIQHRENPDRFLAWHCGNAPVCLARDPQKTALRSFRDMTGELPIEEQDPSAGLARFQLRPGRVIFCRLVEYDYKWKMLIATGEIIPSDEELAGTWAWVQVPDHERLYRTLIEEGFIHHASMIHGDQTKSLLQACKFLDIEPVLVE